MDVHRDRGRVSIRTVADYAAHMPRGGALGQAVGGHMAVTAETDALWAVEYAVIMSAWGAAGGKGKKPKPREYPNGTAAEKAERDRVIEAARRHRARRQKTE
jgi:hypothetical protein